MKRKIAFVCVGQAAGNIGDLLAEKGYNVFAINTSKEDIATLRNVTHTCHVPGGLGCSKDRNMAKAMLADTYEHIVAQLNSYVKEDIIYFIFSAGGGTGSGFSPWFIDILIHDVFMEEIPDEPGEFRRTKDIGVITILASETESPQARENTYNCLSEISNIDGLCNTFLIDNDGQKDLKAVNRIFVDMLDTVLSIPENHKSSNGNIDTSEIVKGFTTPGVSVITKVARKSNMGYIVEKLKNNIFAKIDDSQDGKTLSYVLSSTVEPLDYDTIIAEFGQYVDEFHTFNNECNIVMLTGLPFPKGRIDQIESHLQKDAACLARQSEITQKSIMKSDLNLLGGATAKKPAQKNTAVKNGTQMSRRDELLSRVKRR